MKQGSVYKWSFIDRMSLALINFGVNIALARMLTTADYGLLSMIAIFIAVASDLSSCGLSDGLIHKVRPTERDYSTVFVFNAAFGLIFGLIFFFTAPLTARFFGHEELVGIMRVLGVCFFFQTMSYVQETRFRKELKMKSMCIARISATVTVSVLAIIAAVLGYGYKALICTQILLSFFLFLYYTIISRWFPKIDFSVKTFKELFSYGVHLMMAYLASIIGKNVNTFVLGRFYPSPSASGIYYQGSKLAVVPFGVTEYSLNNPFFAVVSNEEDKERQHGMLTNMFRTIIGVNGTLMLFLCVIAGPCIELLYGDKWLGAIPIFRILVLAEFLFGVKAYLQTVCKVHARTSFVRNMAIVEVSMQLLLLLLFYHKGISWIAWTQVGGVLSAVIVYILYCRRGLLRMTMRDYLSMIAGTLWLPAVASVGALAVLIFIDGMPAIISCIGVVVAFGSIFIAGGELSKSDIYMTVRKLVIKK